MADGKRRLPNLIQNIPDVFDGPKHAYGYRLCVLWKRRTTTVPSLTTSVSGLIRTLRPLLRRHKHIKNLLKGIDEHLALIQHSTATYFPILIQPQPRQLTLAVTARCNLRCIGCRYERDYMLGQELPSHIVKNLLDDARTAGINMVRFYGGEPLLHPALPEMIEHSVQLGMETYITTNGILLKQRIDSLYQAGLRWMTIGFYGTGADYNTYTQRGDQYARLEASLAAVRDRYGKAVDLQLNFVLMRPSCNLKALRDAWAFAERFDMFFHIDLVAYSLPFFTDGPDRLLQLTLHDHSAVLEVGAELVRLKTQHPDRFVHSLPFVRSIPDWLLKGAGMRRVWLSYWTLTSQAARTGLRSGRSVSSIAGPHRSLRARARSCTMC